MLHAYLALKADKLELNCMNRFGLHVVLMDDCVAAEVLAFHYLPKKVMYPSFNPYSLCGQLLNVECNMLHPQLDQHSGG